MADLLQGLSFYVLAFVILAAALGTVLGDNLFHSALLLTVSFLGVGGLYIFLDADFLGAAQFMVYAGAVAVLIVLGIMLTQHAAGGETNPSNRHMACAGLLCVLFTGGMICAYLHTPMPASLCSVQDTVKGLADLMLGRFMMVFELAAVLLLAALVGAILMAKGAMEK